MAGSSPRSAGLGRFHLIASAIAGRLIEVAPVEPGERPWTDGVKIFADADASPPDQLRCVVVQAALLAAGSVDPEVMRALARRPALARAGLFEMIDAYLAGESKGGQRVVRKQR